MRRRTLPTALLLVALATASACGGGHGGDTQAPTATSDSLAAAVGDALALKAPDFDARPPEGGPRVGVTAGTGTGTGVSGEAVTNPQSDTSANIENQFLVLTNNARNAVGVNGLGVEPGLAGYARGVASDIAAAGGLTHSHIEDLLGAWYAAGENIGYGSNAAVIQAAFVASPGHYANMVNPVYGAVGIGVIIDAAGRVWVSLDFAG